MTSQLTVEAHRSYKRAKIVYGGDNHGGRTCTGGKVYTEGGRACEYTCEDPNPICTAQIVNRCQCPDELPLWDDLLKNCVVDVTMCEKHRTESPTKAPTLSPTIPPTAPTSEPTKAPTPFVHPCINGEHGCDYGAGGICHENQTHVGEWYCSCSAGYTCINGCDIPHVGHICHETGGAPGDNDPNNYVRHEDSICPVDGNSFNDIPFGPMALTTAAQACSQSSTCGGFDKVGGNGTYGGTVKFFDMSTNITQCNFQLGSESFFRPMYTATPTPSPTHAGGGGDDDGAR